MNAQPTGSTGMHHINFPSPDKADPTLPLIGMIAKEVIEKVDKLKDEKGISQVVIYDYDPHVIELLADHDVDFQDAMEKVADHLKHLGVKMQDSGSLGFTNSKDMSVDSITNSWTFKVYSK